MSYQIKSTPYFQRMLTKSKRNGELQRLKEEYERVKDFNDHTISLRIRQVRLRRLFREIQDINSSVTAKSKPRRSQPKSYAQLRAEELSRARELGTEYSRENGMHVPRYDPFGSGTSLSTGNRRPQHEAGSSSRARRLQYGNSMSAYNMKKFRQSQMKSFDRATTSTHKQLKGVSSMEVDQIEKLQQRIDYDNSVQKLAEYANNDVLSSSGHKSNKIEEQNHNNSRATIDEDEGPAPQADAVTLPSNVTSQTDVVRNYTFVLDDDGNINIDENVLEYIKANNDLDDDDDDDDEQYVPIAHVLRNAPQLLRNLKVAENANKTKFQETQEAMEEDFDSVPDEVEEENTLRKISNDRNLPASNFRKFVLPTIESADDAQFIENEELIKVSKLDEIGSAANQEEIYQNAKTELSEKEQEKEPPACEQLTPKAFFAERSENGTAPSLKNKPLPTQIASSQAPGLAISHEVKDIVKLYEPFPRESQEPVVVKENFESGVAKLRSIFEHQGE